MKWILGASAHTEVAGIIPQGGPAIAILVASIFVAVIAVIGAIVAMEQQRKPFLWAIIGFVVTIIVVSAVYAVLSIIDASRGSGALRCRDGRLLPRQTIEGRRGEVRLWPGSLVVRQSGVGSLAGLSDRGVGGARS